MHYRRPTKNLLQAAASAGRSAALWRRAVDAASAAEVSGKWVSLCLTLPVGVVLVDLHAAGQHGGKLLLSRVSGLQCLSGKLKRRVVLRDCGRLGVGTGKRGEGSSLCVGQAKLFVVSKYRVDTLGRSA